MASFPNASALPVQTSMLSGPLPVPVLPVPSATASTSLLPPLDALTVSAAEAGAEHLVPDTAFLAADVAAAVAAPNVTDIQATVVQGLAVARDVLPILTCVGACVVACCRRCRKKSPPAQPPQPQPQPPAAQTQASSVAGPSNSASSTAAAS